MANRRQAATPLGLLMIVLLLSHNAVAQDYAGAWGPALGSTLPALEAPDQAGNPRSLDDLAGEQGLLLFLVRSADW